MMTKKLSDLKFKFSYISLQDNLAKDFYEKALGSAKYYDRISSFFDSNILAYYSQGIENIYKNKGKIRFIFSEKLTESDFELMKKGYVDRAEKQLVEKFENGELDELDDVHLSNLAYLISIGMVDIKIAFTKEGINHAKIGLIYDDEDNYVYFRGSSNETVAGIQKNFENFEVSCSRYSEEIETQKIEDAKVVFNKLWNNQFKEAEVVEIPDIIYKKIASYNKNELILINSYVPDNAIVGDINNDGEFIIINNLRDDINIEETFDYRNFIKSKVIAKDKNVYGFGNISYKAINKLIPRFGKLAEIIKQKFYITGRLKQFIKEKMYDIDKLPVLGHAIKQKDPEVVEDFERFSKIVNGELERQLREKQMRDSYFISRMIKSANYSVPGAGKTSIVYGAYGYLTSKIIDEIDNIIVVGPISSFKSRIDEYKACFGKKRELNFLRVRDLKNKDKKEATLRFDSKKYDLILLNYESVDSIKEVLSEIIDSRTLLVYDEVHKVKALNGKWASASLYISGNARYKVVLTGTPIPNSYGDLYNQLHILYKDEYRDYFKFSYGQLKNADEYIMEEINDKIYPFFCRTTKKDLGVPEPEPDKIISSDMNSKEEILFNIIYKRFSKNILLLYIRLLQASTNPKLVLKKIDESMLRDLYEMDEENDKDTDDENNFSKSLKDKVKELNSIGTLNEEEENFIKSIDMTTKFWSGINKIKELVSAGKTVLVRGIFVDTLDRISLELNQLGIDNRIIYGSVSLDEREKIIEDFKNGDFQVLITNPHTMAESVSLHMVCHDAVYFEYSFNLTHMLQSRDRINRLGLPDNQYTQYYYLTLENRTGEDNSIDSKTYKRLKKKEEVMLKAIEGENLVLIDYDLLNEVKIIMNME